MPRTKVNSEKATKVHNRGAISKSKPKAKRPANLQQRRKKNWDEKKLVGGKKSVSFGTNFDIRDSHLDAIVAADPKFCYSSCSFTCGDSESGRGSRLSDAAVSRLTAACPNLVHIAMDSARDLTDAGHSSTCRKCPNIEYICIDGNNKCKGHVGGKALDELKADKKLVKGLRVLHLVDQSSCLEKAVKALSKSRKKLELMVGETSKRRDDDQITSYLGGKSKNEFGFGSFDNFGGGGFSGGYGGGYGRW